MTVPDTGARAFTVTPGQPAKILTDNAGGEDNPATIISDNVGGCRVYLGSDGGVTDSTGVPLDPGTSIPWSVPGQLWAYADPLGTAAASLRLTSAIDQWQPSPVAVATQLLQNGVSVSARTATIFAGHPSPAGQTFDVSAFQSLIVNYSTGGAQVLIRQLDSTGATIDAEVFYVNGTPITWRLIGTKIQVIGDAAANVTIQGSTRPAIARLDSREFAAGLNSYNVSGVVVGVNDFGAAGVFTAVPMGPASVRFAASAGVSAGYFALVEIDGSIVMPVCETTELIVGPSAGKGTIVKTIYIPAQCGWRYVCTGAAGGTVSIVVAAGSVP